MSEIPKRATLAELLDRSTNDTDSPQTLINTDRPCLFAFKDNADVSVRECSRLKYDFHKEYLLFFTFINLILTRNSAILTDNKCFAVNFYE